MYDSTMATIYEKIRTLMAEAERRHAEIDREFEARLQELIGHNGAISVTPTEPPAELIPPPTPQKDDELGGPLPTFPGIRGAVVVPTTDTGRAKKGAVQAAARQILADGQDHKLTDLAGKLGRSKNATFAVLKRMSYEGEVEPRGNGVYRGTAKLIEIATGQEAMQTDT
jgi:hypothetical protein